MSGPITKNKTNISSLLLPGARHFVKMLNLSLGSELGPRSKKLETLFRDNTKTGDPKSLPNGSTFCGATPLFKAQKFIIANKAQNQDFLTSIDR